MRNLYDKEDEHDYSPNELAHLSSGHNDKFKQIVQSNLEPGDTIEKWQERNRKWAQGYLRQQENNRR